MYRPNRCYVEECELQLREHRKWAELTLLYKGRGLHRKALELLATRVEVGDRGSLLCPPEVCSHNPAAYLSRAHPVPVAAGSAWKHSWTTSR